MINTNLNMIRVDNELKQFLDDKKRIPRERYNSCIKRLVHIKRMLKGGKA